MSATQGDELPVVLPGTSDAWSRFGASLGLNPQDEAERMREVMEAYQLGALPRVDLGVWLVTTTDAWPVDPKEGLVMHVRPPRGRVHMEDSRKPLVHETLEAHPWRQRLPHADYRWYVFAADGTTRDREFEFGETLVEHNERMRVTSPPPGPWCMHDDCARYPAMARACLQRA